MRFLVTLPSNTRKLPTLIGSSPEILERALEHHEATLRTKLLVSEICDDSDYGSTFRPGMMGGGAVAQELLATFGVLQ